MIVRQKGNYNDFKVFYKWKSEKCGVPLFLAWTHQHHSGHGGGDVMLWASGATMECLGSCVGTEQSPDLSRNPWQDWKIYVSHSPSQRWMFIFLLIWAFISSSQISTHVVLVYWIKSQWNTSRFMRCNMTKYERNSKTFFFFEDNNNIRLCFSGEEVNWEQFN